MLDVAGVQRLLDVPNEASVAQKRVHKALSSNGCLLYTTHGHKILTGIYTVQLSGAEAVGHNALMYLENQTPPSSFEEVSQEDACARLAAAAGVGSRAAGGVQGAAR